MQTNELETAISQDLKAAIEAFKGDSFDNVNALANRMMSNAIFGTNEKIILPGFFLKDVAFTFMIIKSGKKPSAYATAKAQGYSYVQGLEKALIELNEDQIWKEFLDYDNKIRKYQMSEWEERSYSDNTKFTNESYKWLISYLVSHKQLLLSDPRNQLIKGIINEMVRLYRVHSATLEDVMLLCLVIALDRNYDYARRVWYQPDARIIDENQMNQLIIPAIDKIANLSKEGVKIKEVDTLLWQLVKAWREFFIQFGEMLPQGIALQKGIELPDELKKKLTESLTKTLEKEV